MSQQGPVIFNGRYELHRRLGRGGMAEVYLASDQMLDRPVAVKVLFPALATDPGFVERFRREAQRAAALNHPNIVSVYDWGEANGTYFIVMEYVEGDSLAELIQAEGRLHPDRAAEIASDMAAALGFAHRGGVIHRDVKPGNVLISPEGAVKVADFGIARAISDSSDQNLTKTGSVMGTATYFSPEQARGAAVDPRSDVYSLGCVLYEMITGHPPFSGENAVAIAYKHVQETPVPPRQIDPALPDTLEAIILKCLAKNPANRYPSAQDMRADLRRFLDGARIMAEPVLAPPGDPGATGLMTPTGYMERTATVAQRPWDGDEYGEGYGGGRYDDFDDYDEDEEPKRSKGFLAVLVLLLLLLGGLLFLAARSLSGGDDDDAVMVDVPNVITMQQVDAENTLRQEGFEPKVTQQANDAAVGEVFDQNPKNGEQAEEGSEVEIFVSTGAATAPIPNVVGQTPEQAIRLIEDAGFIAQRGDDEPSDTVEAGNVARQDPAADTPAAEGTTVNYFVASGPNAVAVPNVNGSTEQEARTALTNAGFTVGEVTQQASNEVDDGRVISHSPSGTAAPGSPITLVISTGPDQVEVPPVEGLTESAATAQLQAAGFVPVVTYDTVTRPGDIGRVISQVPGGNQQAPAGSEVSIVVGQLLDDGTTTTTTQPGGGD